MKKHINKVITHPLVSGSAVVFLGTNVANIFHFLFNFSMVRNLSAASYGDVIGLISLITLATTPAASIIPTIINFAARFYAKNEMSQIRGLFFKLSKILYVFGIALFILFLIFSGWIGNFFHIKNPLLIDITGFIVLVNYASITTNGLLQAKLAFTFISITNLIGSILKYGLGLLLVFLGFGAFGAMVAYTFAFLIPYLLSFLQLRFVFDKKIKSDHISSLKLLSYGGPAAIALYTLTSFITTDILLVKHFFSPHDAGLYAVISLAGKIIFFLTAPVASVMFPLVAQRHEKNEKYNDIFLLAILFIFVISFGLTLFYYLFPTIILMLFNQQKNGIFIQPYLVPYGIFMSLYSLLSVTTNFFLSIGKTKIYIPLIIGGVLQIGLIWLFHTSFLEVIYISISIISLLLCMFLLYYWKLNAKRE
jgi:O-antigen/teichoic acid export membrane protein